MLNFAFDFFGIAFVLTLLIQFFIGLPLVIIWGWARWAKRGQPRTLLSALSLFGFALATVSALLAFYWMYSTRSLSTSGCGCTHFPFGPPLVKVVERGLRLSYYALIAAIIGVVGRGPLRWHAPVSAGVTWLYWLSRFTH